jgi:predicted dehydrogenase
MQAIEAGKHVVVEKPLANNLSDALALVAGAESAGVTLSVCFPHRFAPAAALARKLVAGGALGELSGTLTSFLTDKPLSYWRGGFSGRAQSDWRTSRARAGGGVLIMNLTHYIDLVRHITGVEVESVTAVCASADRAADVEDTISVGLHYENGAVGTIFGCSAVRGIDGRNELRIWGRDGQLSLEPDLRVLSLRPVDGLRTGRWLSPASDDRNMRAVYLSRLGTAITEGREPDVTAQDGLAVQALVEAAYQAHEERTVVRPRALLERSRP